MAGISAPPHLLMPSITSVAFQLNMYIQFYSLYSLDHFSNMGDEIHVICQDDPFMVGGGGGNFLSTKPVPTTPFQILIVYIYM